MTTATPEATSAPPRGYSATKDAAIDGRSEEMTTEVMGTMQSIGPRTRPAGAGVLPS